MNKEKNKHFIKTFRVYFFFTVLAIGTAKVYTLFGHGVKSDTMNYMFLYPLIGGMVFFGLIGKLSPDILSHKHYRFAYNIYNSGIATLTLTSFLIGIMDIAGTASNYNTILFLVGLFFTLLGLFIILYQIFNIKKMKGNLSYEKI